VADRLCRGHPSPTDGRDSLRGKRFPRWALQCLGYNSRLHHIGLARRHAGTPVLLLIADLDNSILTEDGELLQHLTLDPTRDYQPQSQP
jgi:hypothetical protein